MFVINQIFTYSVPGKQVLLHTEDNSFCNKLFYQWLTGTCFVFKILPGKLYECAFMYKFVSYSGIFLGLFLYGVSRVFQAYSTYMETFALTLTNKLPLSFHGRFIYFR